MRGKRKKKGRKKQEKAEERKSTIRTLLAELSAFLAFDALDYECDYESRSETSILAAHSLAYPQAPNNLCDPCIIFVNVGINLLKLIFVVP